ncbi:nitrite reductase (NADH) small subunit [Chitinophaga skermanii]|uniref:Nitrite reductase (NADH) small subunit n=1 Tax=Chitinophaga skermanii TaxID=331697 RepID=A0A327QLS1_9BACT|nr:nitrite reductase small subunit NirD [Chitinophaga skermanii]RAJ04293.1 nitrite reductase (NADH) small subunit [Chitinophaga skermanii]
MSSEFSWFLACRVQDVPANGGVCVKYANTQIALFHFTRTGQWFATQNLCPHKHQMALSRGMIGSHAGEPKVACPFHKKTFSLKDGRCISDETECHIQTYPVRIEGDDIFIGFTAQPAFIQTSTH